MKHKSQVNQSKEWTSYQLFLIYNKKQQNVIDKNLAKIEHFSIYQKIGSLCPFSNLLKFPRF